MQKKMIQGENISLSFFDTSFQFQTQSKYNFSPHFTSLQYCKVLESIIPVGGTEHFTDGQVVGKKYDQRETTATLRPNGLVRPDVNTPRLIVFGITSSISYPPLVLHYHFRVILLGLFRSGYFNVLFNAHSYTGNRSIHCTEAIYSV